MKALLILSILATVVLSSSECSRKKNISKKLRGRLEIKGICYNYTIKLISGSIDTFLISAVWTDPETSKSYANVFGLSEPCSFPDTIKEGEEFDFIIDTAQPVSCVVCEAYYPTPPRSLNIKVEKK